MENSSLLSGTFSHDPTLLRFSSLHVIHPFLNLIHKHKSSQIITARSICMDLNYKIHSSSNLAIKMRPSAEK